MFIFYGVFDWIVEVFIVLFRGLSRWNYSLWEFACREGKREVYAFLEFFFKVGFVIFIRILLIKAGYRVIRTFWGWGSVRYYW